ncbi:MAG: alkaline phosphatase family protein [Firmicutes bacterium]|nr:alkaline phosphatase family protein [Bacillota bacterium]
MKTTKPDYRNSIVNLSNSLLHRYNINPFHSTIQAVYDILVKHDKIVVLLFDGLGKALIKKHLEPSSFLVKNYFTTITSTFPPTTVAATTGLLSGRFPIENGWLGWSQYFNDFKCNVDVFTNENSVTKIRVSNENEMRKVASYKDIFQMVAEKNPKIRVASVWPSIVEKGTARDLPDFFDKVREVVSIKGEKFIYGYWLQPDGLIHMTGVGSEEVHKTILDINAGVSKLAYDFPDTLFLVLADHGLVDIRFVAIEEHADFYDTLRRPFSNEPRAAFFFVKRGRKREFARLFKKYYGNEFVLKTKRQVLKEEWFGEGTPHPIVKHFLGDYLAIATDQTCFDYLLNGQMAHSRFKAHHAGLTDDEMLIDLMIMNK